MKKDYCFVEVFKDCSHVLIEITHHVGADGMPFIEAVCVGYAVFMLDSYTVYSMQPEPKALSFREASLSDATELLVRKLNISL